MKERSKYMINLRNDYSCIADKKILERMLVLQDEVNIGYGLDEHSKKAEQLILKHIKSNDSKVYFLSGGTITNKVFISHVLRPYEAVIALDSAHISCHETGTIEQSGHKIINVKHSNGKIKVSDIKEVINVHKDEHMVKPKLVYITNSTEFGTIYTKKELIEIYDFCKENDLYLYLDGARLGVALCAVNNDISLEDLGKYTDAFYIGGTKNGAILGEALVINNKHLQKDFRYSIKHFGGMYAKGFVSGIQFEVLFEDNLFFNIASKQNNLAYKLRNELIKLGVEFEIDSDTNQLFPIFKKEVVKKLENEIMFEYWTEFSDKQTIRFVTNFTLEEKDIVKAIEIIRDAL